MINVAIDAAKQAGTLAYRYFKTQPKISYKADNSPVTRADIEAEKLIRKIIAKKFPDHGIIGEELENTNPKAKYQWVIDPIDGTKDFVRKLPLWSTLLAVLEDGKPIIGIAFYPSSDEFFFAQKNKGAFLNGKRTKVSRVLNLSLATVVHGSISRFKTFERFLKVCKMSQSRRALGSYNLNSILQGKADVEMEPAGGIWDFGAPAILVEEAGGKFTDFNGDTKIDSGNFVATNGLLHNQVLRLLNQ